MKPGIYPDITAAEYRADPCDVPSLTASAAKALWHASPLHAWTANPRLNPNYQRVEAERFDLGTIVHEAFLLGEASVELIDAPDYRTRAAQDARAEARLAGKTPLLQKDWPGVIEMLAALDAQLRSHRADPPLFHEGTPETCLVWEEEGGVFCRARLDWLRLDRLAVDDLKTTTRSANPRTWARTLFGLGFDIQAEFYCRGVHLLTGERPAFRLVVVESSPPYAVSVISLAPDAETIARKKVDHAIEIWRRCLTADEWPGYPEEIAYATVPSWEETETLEAELEGAA